MHIAVAMSGGVDSSVAAIMLKRLGHEVIGITVHTAFREEYSGSIGGNTTYCIPQYIIDAKRIAREHNFPHKVLDISGGFYEEIIRPFCEEYLKGRTPNPCIVCNTRIKFKKIIDYAKAIGCDKIAAGHYARIRRSENERYYISEGLDKRKEQSYFLFMLSQEILQHIMLPLGEYHKDAIGRMAKSFGLHIAGKPDNRDICFIKGNNYSEFIERVTGITPLPGDIVDKDGNVIGKHKGIHNYTIGQRRGIGISAERPLYIVAIDTERNRIAAGYKEDLYMKGLFAKEVYYMKDSSLDRVDAYVKIRPGQKPFRANLKEEDDGVYVYFDEPKMGITPGQAAVFYNRNGDVIGGAWIEKGL